MSLQLHRPDGEGGLEPRPVADQDWRRPARARRAGARPCSGGRLPELKNPEMNPTSRFSSVLFWLGLGVATFVLLVAGYGTGFWTLGPAPSTGRYRQVSPYTSRPMRFLSRFVDSNDRELRRIQPHGRRGQRPRGRVRGACPTTRSAPSSPRSATRSARLADARRAVRGRAPPPGPRASPRAAQGAPQARERAHPDGPRRRRCPRSSRWPARR